MEKWTKVGLLKDLSRFHNTTYSWRSLGGRTLEVFHRAAILVPLFIRDGTINILLTVRSAKVTHDKEMVALPGGMVHDEDADESDTALRETWEEIGIKPHEVQVAATLVPRVNNRRTLMTPVVGIIDANFVTKPNEEVSDVFTLPLSRFLSKERHTTVEFTNRGIRNYLHSFNDHIGRKKYRTFGLTASVCVELAVGLLQQETEFCYMPDKQISVKDPFLYQKEYLKILECQYKPET